MNDFVFDGVTESVMDFFCLDKILAIWKTQLNCHY
jgi:hypothetical protein